MLTSPITSMKTSMSSTSITKSIIASAKSLTWSPMAMPWRLVSVRTISTEAVFQDILQKQLSDYFDSQKFKFTKDEHVEYLRTQMERVNLRKVPLVSVDVEAYERALTKVTEIGVAIYDPQGQKLSVLPHIKTLHIIIKEHKKLVNKTYVPNNKFVFNGGTSYEMTQSQSKNFLTKLFTHYFNDRKAVLVGHSVAGDVKWLQRHGLHDSESLPTLDTQKLYQISRRRGATLRGILRHIGIMHANLHNAANDAYYTLLAAMKYCDPTQRIALGLDTYDNLDQFMNQTKAQKAAAANLAKSQKFSDRSTVEKDVPEIEKFLSDVVESESTSI